MHEIEEFVNELDIGKFLSSGVIEKDLLTVPSKSKVVSKVVFSQGKYILTYLEGYLHQQSKDVYSLAVKISGICLDNSF